MAATKRLPVDPIAEAKRQWIAHGWESAAGGMTAVTSIIRAQQLMFARMASAIARLQVHPTSVTNTVDRLARDGLVSREPHPADGRAAMLVLTDAGRELVERATSALNTEVFESPGLNDTDTTELVRIIARLRKDAGDFTDPKPQPDPL